MLRSIARLSFIDREWGTETLDCAAEFWFRVYAVGDLRANLGPPRHSVVLLLTGFPRPTASAVSAELVQRFAEAGEKVEVTSPNPDTLSVKSGPWRDGQPSISAFGLSSLAGTPFDGLAVEVRFTVCAADAEGPTGIGATLVIVGELRSGALAVKAMWREPPHIPPPGGFLVPGDWVDTVPTAFDHYRRDGEVDPVFAAVAVHNPPLAVQPDRSSWLFRWLDASGPGSRVRGLAVRVGVLALLAVCCAYLWWAWFVGPGRGHPPFHCHLAFGIWFTVAYFFFCTEWPRLVPTYAQRRDWYGAIYQSPVRYADVGPNDSRPWLNDPTVRQLTAEALAAGFVHFGDAAAVPAESATAAHRTFLAPDGVTYLALAFQYAGVHADALCSFWPATVSVLYQTFDTSGRRFETVDEHSAFDGMLRRHPTATWQTVSPGTHFLEMYEAHVKAIVTWAKAASTGLVAHMSFDAFRKRQEDVFSEEREMYQSRPYSWRDHIRWYLQLDAKPPAKSD